MPDAHVEAALAAWPAHLRRTGVAADDLEELDDNLLTRSKTRSTPAEVCRRGHRLAYATGGLQALSTLDAPALLGDGPGDTMVRLVQAIVIAILSLGILGSRITRFNMHFTPTSAPWRDKAKRFFRDITIKRIRRGVFPSVRALVAAIKDYIDEHNMAPKPFIWTAKASDILAKVSRAKAALSDNAPSV